MDGVYWADSDRTILCNYDAKKTEFQGGKYENAETTEQAYAHTGLEFSWNAQFPHFIASLRRKYFGNKTYTFSIHTIPIPFKVYK
jgi:hypothetical protein